MNMSRYIFVFILCYLPVWSYSQSLYPFEQDGKWGYKNYYKEVVIQPQYQEAKDFYNNFAVVKLNDKYGYIDKNGKPLGTISYEYAIGIDQNNVGAVFQNGKWGLINQKGKMTTGFIYEEVMLHHHTIPAKKEGKWGVIDAKGKTLLGFNYEYTNYASDSYFPVQINELFGFVDSKGKTLIPFEYTNAYGFYKGLAEVWKGELCGLIDQHNNIVVPMQFDYVEAAYIKELVLTSKNNLYGLYTSKGVKLVDPKYTSIGDEKDGLIMVSIGMKSGLLDMNGKEVLETVYDYIDWDEGICYVIGKDLKYGLFDPKQQKMVTEIIYNAIEPSEYENLFTAFGDNGFGLLSNTGKLVLSPEYDEIMVFSKKKMIVAHKGNTNYTYNMEGELLKSETDQ
jgi:hypothetical protein